MPSKKKAASELPTIPKELIDQLVTGPMTPEAVHAASMAFKKALIERTLGAELSHHLGYKPGSVKPEEAGNHRNGHTPGLRWVSELNMTTRLPHLFPAITTQRAQ